MELIAKRLINTISAPLSFDRKGTQGLYQYRDTVSGHAAAATSQTEHLINDADSAGRYLRKKAGRGCAIFHEEAVTEAAA